MCKKLICVIGVSVILALASTSQAIVIGNWEDGSWDGWTADETAVRFDDVNGVTLGKSALRVYFAQNDWHQDFLKIDLIAAGLVDIFRANQKISVDVTHHLADWPESPTPGWNGIHMVLNAGGDGWSAWTASPQLQNWTRRWNSEDATQTATWNYASNFGTWHGLQDVWWCELIIISNCNDTNYSGPVTFYLDNVQLFGAGGALLPDPANNAADVPTDVTLSWAPGTYAASHDVYLGTDPTSVANARHNSDPNVVYANVDAPSYDPGTLQFNTRYSWRVDEVNDDEDSSPWIGPVWSFTTANFLVIDDFESYTNESPNRLFQIWRDGLGFSKDEFFPNGYGGNGTGSIVGFDPSFGDIMETTNPHGGTKAMPIAYDNTDVKISETVRTWEQPQDWTRGNFGLLTLYLRGLADNVPDSLYIKVKDSTGHVETEENPDPSILTNTEWTEWAIPVSDFTTVNLAAVTEMTIGVGSLSTAKASTGTLFVDDITVKPKPFGVVAHYAMENSVDDSSGNGFNGTVEGDPNMPMTYVAGPAGFGTAAQFDGQVGHERIELGTFNPSAATGQLTVALWAKWDGITGNYQGLIGKKFSDWSSEAMMWQIEIRAFETGVQVQREGTNDIVIASDVPVGQWVHMAFTCDGTTGRSYFDGAFVNEVAFSLGYALNAPVHIGCSSMDGGNPFHGAIDDVWIYDRVLTEAEIAALAGK
jgi:hypothetical protein